MVQYLTVFNIILVAGDSTCGQRALYPVGMTGIPIINVNNNCATGSSALYLAFQAIRGGQTHCALALGFEKMQRGSLSSQVGHGECASWVSWFACLVFLACGSFYTMPQLV